MKGTRIISQFIRLISDTQIKIGLLPNKYKVEEHCGL